MKKKLLLFGNKRINGVDKEMIDIINSFDVIMRINKMDNVSETGERVDWWWFDYCIFKDIKEFHFKKYLSNLSKVMMNWKSICQLTKWVSDFELKLFKKNINHEGESKIKRLKLFFPELPDSCIMVENKNYSHYFLCERNKYWDIDEDNKTVPTTFVIALSHLINECSDEYDIYITCTDLEGRGELFKTNPIWSESWHRNVGQYEEDYIKLMIKEGKIKYLNIDDKNIHNS